jgi:hypothetical protein
VVQRKSHILIVAGLAALAATSVAQAKGPIEATVRGPGLAAPIVFHAAGIGTGGKLGQLVRQTGFFEAVFGTGPIPSLKLRDRPTGELGARYTIVYDLSTTATAKDVIRMDLYPHAPHGPVTYMKPGRRVFGRTTVGGWFRAPLSLKRMLVAAGLPATSPSGSAGSPSFWSLPAVALMAIGLSVFLGAVVVRPRHWDVRARRARRARLRLRSKPTSS